MNEAFVIEFIYQRMRELRICNYHFEPFYFTVTPSSNVSFYVTNEYLYLLDYPQGIVIESDSSYYDPSDQGLPFSNAPEFTGLIRIKVIGGLFSPLLLRFIRVTVQTPCNDLLHKKHKP